ncbi:hypothetical protein PIB30_088945 [Stylosanthes scabra]|uniref:Ubiquitin-like protease family profile domain-containing protein n=1 Tax=Stylosanthes scabra TaxID=79078 RepID=A0ABU6ZSJ0_9FABA|nr:hypothetical protein [Stylosanthes scabra]
MLKIVIPTFDHKGIGFPSRYAQVPKQPNNDDCGIYVIKFMEEWNEDSNLIAYTNKAFTVSKRRNNPNSDKKKEVRSPFIAPRTNEITRRAEKRNVEEKGKQ